MREFNKKFVKFCGRKDSLARPAKSEGKGQGVTKRG